jgi:peptide/nickel transport system ATP-binding protein
MSASLEVKNLKVYFPVKHGIFSRVHESVKAVDDVSFSIAPGETLGLVGESGCGKTTLARAIARLIEPTTGEISLNGENITQMTGSKLRARRRKFQMILKGSVNDIVILCGHFTVNVTPAAAWQCP